PAVRIKTSPLTPNVHPVSPNSLSLPLAAVSRWGSPARPPFLPFFSSSLAVFSMPTWFARSSASARPLAASASSKERVGETSQADAVAAEPAPRGSGGSPNDSRHAHKPYTGFLNAFTRIYRDEGLGGLFRGVKPRLAVQIPAVAISWTS